MEKDQIITDECQWAVLYLHDWETWEERAKDAGWKEVMGEKHTWMLVDKATRTPIAYTYAVDAAELCKTQRLAKRVWPECHGIYRTESEAHKVVAGMGESKEKYHVARAHQRRYEGE